MKMIFEIENHEDAVAAQKMLSAYLGTEAPKVVAEVEEKVQAVRAKDSIKKDEKPARASKPAKPVKEEEVVEEETTDDKDVGEVTLAELTQIAKDAVGRSDRNQVKDVISTYGEKLSAVEEADYTALAEELKAL